VGVDDGTFGDIIIERYDEPNFDVLRDASNTIDPSNDIFDVQTSD
jgi:hypothetical protein